MPEYMNSPIKVSVAKKPSIVGVAIDNSAVSSSIGVAVNQSMVRIIERDGSKIFGSIVEAQNYAKTDSDAYIGQSLTVADMDNETVTVYIIANSNMELESVGGSLHIVDYLSLDNKPQINNVVLSGNKNSEDLGIETYALSNSDIESIFTEE